MESVHDSKRVLLGILLGILLLVITSGVSALSVFMVSLLVFGCVSSPPDWLFSVIFFGFPIPLVISSILIPYLYIKRSKASLIVLSAVSGLFSSCMIFFVWFLLLTRYC